VEVNWQEIVALDRNRESTSSPTKPVILKKRELRKIANQTGYERVVFVPDLHCPYHDVGVWNQVLAFIKDYEPDRIVFLGDVIDAYPVSRFSKDPSRRETMQDEFDSGHGVLREARLAAPDALIDYTPGNHEKRVDLFMWTQAPALASLRCMSLEALLRTSELEIVLHPYAGFKLRERFRCTHGTYVRKHAGHSAKAELDHWGISGASGHTHRAGMYTVTNDSGTSSWTEFGHLCDVSKADYVTSPNWQQAFGIGEFRRDSSRYQVELIQIAGRELVYHGKNYADPLSW
jgi:predicted phosphodiesterase